MSSNSLDSSLDILIEYAYEIADEKKLYGVRKKLPKNHEPDFALDGKSFETYVRYSANKNIYTKWIDDVTKVFDDFGLQSKKFRVKINEYDPTVESNLPAQLFLRAVKEIEQVRSSKDYRKSYISKRRISPATLKGNVLTQGDTSHKFSKQYAELIHLVWTGRRIVDSSGSILQKETPITKNMLAACLNIGQTDLTRMQKAIAGIKKKTGINIKLSFPRGTSAVFIVIVQDYR